MECNKEEAIRAMDLAERKMQNGDFSGAQRIGLKAQRLYPGLNNISQLLAICDVHCSAENKLNGSEMDWYRILRIERLSDESVVKKQFRKLALSLHPDKNKFPGAEAAFKLIGEANRVLTDPAKRVAYDARYYGAPTPAKPQPEQPNQNTTKKQKPTANGASRPAKPKPKQSNQNTTKKQYPAADKICSDPQYMSGPPPMQAVFFFWTRCPACKMCYQCHIIYQNKMLKCLNCPQMYIAYDLGVPSGTGFTKVPIPNGKAADTAGTFQSKEANMETATEIGKDSKRGSSVLIPEAGKAAYNVGNFQSEGAKMETVSEIGKDSKQCSSVPVPKVGKAADTAGTFQSTGVKMETVSERGSSVPVPEVGKAADASGTFQSEGAKMETLSEIGKDSKTGSSVPIPKAGKAADTSGNFQSKGAKLETSSENVTDSKRGCSVSMHDVSKTKGSGIAECTSNKRCREPVGKSSKSSDSGTSEGKQNGSNLSTPKKPQLSDGQQSKRSLRKKPDITYNEKLNDDGDDDFVVPPKRSKGGDSPIMTDKEMKEASGANDEMKQRARSRQDDKPLNKKSKTRDSKVKEDEIVMPDMASEIGANNLKSNEAPKSDICEIPDPDFSNFEIEREKTAFAVNQVWAIYDSLDSMPRFYARIRKVINPGFKLQITWLETSSKKKAERKWSNSGLPVACGRYVNGDTEIIEDTLMFSHKMSFVNAGFNGCYFVYPKKGETWALYKNWNLEWSKKPDKHVPPFDFDIVEILTDFIEEAGIGVVYLGKVKGFISIFQRDSRNGVLAFTIHPNEMYKFSHQIPSFKLTGKEREGVPVGSYELDTAALPTDFCTLVDNDKISTPKKLEKSPVRKNTEKSKFGVDTSKPRRSPRDLSKGRSQIHGSRQKLSLNTLQQSKITAYISRGT